MSTCKQNKPTFRSWALDDDEDTDAEQENILCAADTGSKLTSLFDIFCIDDNIIEKMYTVVHVKNTNAQDSCILTGSSIVKIQTL